MMHKVKYAGPIEYDTVAAEWPRCTWAEAIGHAARAAKEHAARYGDKVHELVSIDGRIITARENMHARTIYR